MGKTGKRRGWPELPEPLLRPVIDNHTHIALRENQIPNRGGQQPSVAQQLQEAAQVGVHSVISSGCQLDEWQGTVELCQTYPGVYCALAIHPNEAPLHERIVAKSPDGETYQPESYHLEYSLERALEHLFDTVNSSDYVVAVGETGLDYFRTSEHGKEAQERSFKAHIAMAKELGLPMQIHDRDAHADTVRILLSEGAPERTVFHCFSGDRELAEILREHGWYASFAGPITYNANQHLRDACLAMPRELVLVETDAPYLTPVPHRGQPNASYVIPYTARAIADLWGLSEEDGLSQLWDNTIDAYGEKITSAALKQID